MQIRTARRYDFRTLFCDSFECTPQEFEAQAFRQCLHWHARILEPVIRKFKPNYFAHDLTLVKYLGTASGHRDARLELEAFREANRAHRSIARNLLCLRVSTTKTARLAHALFESRDRLPSSGPIPSILEWH